MGGVRKKEYLGDPSPQIRRLAGEGYVFHEDHCERVWSHDRAFNELLQGREWNSASPAYPGIIDYIGRGTQVDSLLDIPQIMQQSAPRIIVCRLTGYDVGHIGYEEYLNAVKATDRAIGTLFDWVKNHPYFHENTAIVVRPEFGRDDEVNEHGHLHHSCGFYGSHRVATIFWGPDFNRGADDRTVISSLDLAPTLARVFNARATYAEGRVVPGLFKTAVESS
jgi:arylsulfatase A-like enzyme